MSFADFVRKRVDQFVVENTRPEAVRARVAAYARENVAALIQAGSSPVYRRFVDGREGAAEEDVRLNGGTITYLFSRIQQAAVFALAEARARSPSKSGSYRDSWFLIVNGQPYAGRLEDIPTGAEVAITNTRPYHRKIETGAQITSVPPGIVEDVRQAVMKRFPGLDVQRMFLVFPGGSSEPQAFPYILKKHGIESGLSFDRKTGIWTRRRAPRVTRRSDRAPGQPLSYPAIVINDTPA